MCGRFVRFTPRKTFAEMAGIDVSALPVGETHPSWNIAPGRACTLVRHTLEAGRPVLESFLWSLIPHWSESRPTLKPINARIETAGVQPMFRRVFRYRRCLVAADGWMEWRQESAGKQPYFICRQDRRPFFFGGLYDEWRAPGVEGIIPTFTILTQDAIPSIGSIHDRMPVIVQPEHYAAWMDKGITEAVDVMALCKPPDAGELLAYRVSKAVNSPKVDKEELIMPLV